MSPLHILGALLGVLFLAIAYSQYEPIVCRDTFYVISSTTDASATCGVNHDLGIREVGDKIHVKCSCKYHRLWVREPR